MEAMPGQGQTRPSRGERLSRGLTMLRYHHHPPDALIFYL